MTLWRDILKKNFRDWTKLADFLQLDLPACPSHFPLNLPLRLAQKIGKNNPHDPILRQFLPSNEEMVDVPGFSTDPVGDLPARIEKKLLQKYQGRALMVATSVCAMNCRFCFRRNFDYETEDKTFDRELESLQNDPSISEIILSGGDPLSLSDQKLSSLISRLEKIPHLQRLRFHTRYPIGIPERIDAHFLQILEKTRLQTIFIVHINHPYELDPDIFFALKKVQTLGIPLLNQTVLLRGVNDDLQTLKTLFETLVDHGIIPYYLHQLDQVKGAAHFEVSESEGLELMEKLGMLLPGYALPRYVKEIPGMAAKMEVEENRCH